MDENANASKLNDALEEMWDSLTDEQREKAKQCKTMDELMQLAGRMGVELPDELLDNVAGGYIRQYTTATDGNLQLHITYDYVDDKTGEVYKTLYANQGNPEQIAKQLSAEKQRKVSAEFIDDEQWARLKSTGSINARKSGCG